jgi:nucleoside-diphosphate-sugar epimerase
MSNIILFGGSGLLGPVILKKDPSIISLGRTKPPSDIINKHINFKTLDNLDFLDDLQFDKVIFLIGSSNHHEINNTVTMGIDCNVYPLKKILTYLSKRKIKKFICFTTVLLYDENKMFFPVDETQEINPYINDYVFSKYLSEEIVKYYGERIPSIIIRLSNIYGYTKLNRPDLVPTIMQDIFKKKELKIWNDKPKRDFIFTEDAADAVLKLLDTDFTGIINIATGETTPISEITYIIEKLSGKKIISENKPVSGPMELKMNISLLNKLTGWTPKHTLEEGLTKTYKIMKKYFEEKDRDA